MTDPSRLPNTTPGIGSMWLVCSVTNFRVEWNGSLRVSCRSIVRRMGQSSPTNRDSCGATALLRSLKWNCPITAALANTTASSLTAVLCTVFVVAVVVVVVLLSCVVVVVVVVAGVVVVVVEEEALLEVAVNGKNASI